jgi:Kef-type K+ transport system membrane component KefB
VLNNIWFIAAIWMGLALLGSLISIWTGISVALFEILVGVLAANIALGFEGGTLQIGIAGGNVDAGQLHHVLQSTEWTNFLAMLGTGVLTFLAGAEIDPRSLRANWRASVLIGFSPLRFRSASSGLPRNSSLVGHCIRRKTPGLHCPRHQLRSFTQ